MSKKEQQLLNACVNGELATVKSLLSTSNCDPEIRDRQGNTPLHLACEGAHANIVRFLIEEKGCDVNCQANNGSTPLHCVLNINRFSHYKVRDTIKVILQNRCDTTLADSRGKTPQTIPLNEDGDLLLHIACLWGDVDIVSYLVCEQFCVVNAWNKNGDSPLHMACYCKAFDCIKFLLQQRCDTRVRNKRGQSPQTIPLNKDGDLLLHIACQWGDVDIVSYLVCEQFCVVNAWNKNGDSPLHMACYCKAFDCINFLLQQRCDTMVRNKRGQSPQTIPLNKDGDLLLHIACQWGDVDIVRYLVCEQHCNVNVQNKNGALPLHVASQGMNVGIVKFLITEQHCDMNARSKNGDSPLHKACYYKAFDCIKFLLQQTCDTSVRNKKGKSPQTVPLNKHGDRLLHIACQWGDVDIVRYLVSEQQCDVNVRNKNGDSPLHITCYYKAFDCIKFLLQQTCDTSVRNKKGKSPQTVPLNKHGDLLLHIACQWGDVDIVRCLVCEQHCDVNVRNKNSDSPLHIACYCKNVDIIKFLLQQRCDTSVVNKKGKSPQSIPLNEDGDLLLHMACQWGDVDIVRYLVSEQHCDVNVRNKSCDSPLHVACQGTNLGIVEYLITEQYCDVNVQNKNGDTLLHIACYCKNLDIIKFLLQQRCDTSVVNKKGKSPQTIPLNEDGNLLLHMACQWGDVDIVSYLVCEQHCDVNVWNKNGDSPLQIACCLKALDIIKFFLQQRCDTSIVNKKGKSPQTIPLNENGDLLLHMACQWGDVDIVRYLVSEQHCDVNVRNKSRDSPLHVACQGQNLGIVEYLITEQHCDVNVQNKNWDTHLHIACYCKNLDIIKFLLNCRCDTTMQNKGGQSPQIIPLSDNGDLLLHVACHWGDVDIVRYLVSEQHCDVNVQNKNGDSPLHIACCNNALGIIKFLLQQRCDTSVRNKRGQSPQTIPLNEDGDLLLHMACQWGDVDIVRHLVCEQHCDMNVRNKNGDSPLQIACCLKALDIIKFLLQQRCDISVVNKKGKSPQTIPLNEDGNLLLHMACQWGDVDIVRYLVSEQHCDVNVRNKSRDSPLHVACQGTNLGIVEYLITEQHCDVNVQNKNGDALLHIACYYKNLDIIKFFLQQRCDTSVVNKKGKSPQTIPLNEDGDLLLHIACQWGDVDIVRYLVSEQHCDVNVRNKSRDLPLHVACQGTNLGIVEYLITEQHCDVNVQNKNGDTLLHIACYCKNLDIIKFLLQQRCKTRIQNKKGKRPPMIPLNEDGNFLLHMACQWGDVDIVKYLVSEQHCDVNVRSKSRDSLLHVACQGQNLGILEYLITEQHCDVNVQNRKGDSLLHIACYCKNLDIIKFLLNRRCDTTMQNKGGQTPQIIPLSDNGDLLLHVACHWGDVDIVRYLVSEQHCDVNVQNKNGDSPLHIACHYKGFDIIKFLLQQRCNTSFHNQRGQSPQTIPLNEDGDLLLHMACQWGDVDIVSYLVCEQHCDVNVRNKNGDSPLQIACCLKALDIIKFFLQQRCDTSIVNKNGKSPQTIPLNENGDLLLHIACQWGDVDIVRYLMYEQHCDVNIQNKKGYSPLHTAISSCTASTALCLLQHIECNCILPDSDGNTPLHLACMNVDTNSEMVPVARFLLSSVDPSCVNNVGQAPVELTTNYQLLQDISHFTECKTKHSIQTYVKIFFIGNPSTGKSTLVEAISSETSWWWKLLPHWLRKVKDVPLHTAGIIPSTFRSKTFGNTVLYDMAGQYEYYSSHAAVIENTVLSSPPAFIVVVNLNESDDKIMERLKYWWSFIDNHATRSTAPPHVILVGSHADVVKARGVSAQEIMLTISSALRDLSSSFHFAGQVALDCRDPVSNELVQLCCLVDESCTALRQTADIDLRCHVTYSFLLDTYKGNVACTLSDIAAQITATDTLLPQSPDELAHLVSSLNDKGLVLLVRASDSIEESWVILQKEKLLNDFDGTIFAPENFREHKDFARSTGVVRFSRIKHEFPQYDPAMIAGFLTHLEFCFKIDDPETIKRIEDESLEDIDETSLDPSDEYYFFPALVSVDNPHHVWQPDDSMQHQCGWYYRCHPDQFLTTRFLQVLILRLAFSFALGLDKYHRSQRAPVLCRRCSVWKHGIGWLQNGVEIVVEVGLQCQWVTVMMRCLKGKKIKCVQLRSAVIKEVKNARNELCKAVKMTELLIHPSNVHYPFSDEQVSLYSLTDIANAIAKMETHVDEQQCHNSKTVIPLCDLALFEPYLSVSPELLNELFHPDNSDKPVSESFLCHLASRIHPQMSFFEEVIDPQPVIDYQKELEEQSLPASKCLILLQSLLRKLKNPTYENFHKELDKYSIFCGMNPMVSESSCKHSLCKTVPV